GRRRRRDSRDRHRARHRRQRVHPRRDDHPPAQPMIRGWGRRGLAAGAALAMTATLAGCGVRWTDAQRAGVLRSHGRGIAAGTAAAAGADTGPAADSSGAAADSGTGGTGQTAAASTGSKSTGGTTTGGTQSRAAAGSAPCAAASTAPGVSKDTITVANISTVSGPVPGLGATAVAAVRAYAAYRNSTGGVCGRKIDV